MFASHPKRVAFHSRIRGLTLLELSFSISLSGIILATIYSQADFYADFNKALATARHQRQFADAAQRYWEDHGGSGTVTLTELTGRYLPPEFAQRNAYGQALTGCPISANEFIVVATGGNNIPPGIFRFAKGLLGPGAYAAGTNEQLCGLTASGRLATKLTLRSAAERQGYVSKDGGQMKTALLMDNHDITGANRIQARQLSATAGTFSDVGVGGTLGVSQYLSSTLINVQGLAEVKTSATINFGAINTLSATSNTSMAVFNFPNKFARGGDCSQYGTGALASPFDRTTGLLYCDSQKKWKDLTRTNLRVVYSLESDNTDQTAWCDPGEVVISGGGFGAANYGQQLDIASRSSTKTLPGKWSSTSIPYTAWFLTMTESDNNQNGNVKGNLTRLQPVVSTDGKKWGWSVKSTHPKFRDPKRAATAVCLCIGDYQPGLSGQPGNCTWDPGATRPTAIDITNDVVNN